MTLTLLILSVIANGLLIWYIVQLLKKILTDDENIGDLVDKLNNFSAHLEALYNQETFYADERLQSLLQHSKEIVEEVEAYAELYDFIQEKDNEVEE